MSLNNLDRHSNPADWDAKWVGIFNHYQRDLRHAHYIRAMLEPGEESLLEIAAGSFRDMAALRRMGINCSGMDFSGESVARAKSAFPPYADYIHRMSAFEISFADDSFDVTYHNGFWIYFNDQNIKTLAQEQARITKKHMIATVHNIHNQRFVDYFDKMKQSDPLYDIRFFAVDEISSLMREVCNDVRVIPVGKYKRRHEDMMIKLGLTHPTLIRSYLDVSGHHLLDRSERLLCIGTPR
jgi:hypothetical protein